MPLSSPEHLSRAASAWQCPRDLARGHAAGRAGPGVSSRETREQGRARAGCCAWSGDLPVKQGTECRFGTRKSSRKLSPVSAESGAQHPGRSARGGRRKQKWTFISFCCLSGVSLWVSGAPLCPSCPQHHAWNR